MAISRLKLVVVSAVLTLLLAACSGSSATDLPAKITPTNLAEPEAQSEDAELEEPGESEESVGWDEGDDWIEDPFVEDPTDDAEEPDNLEGLDDALIELHEFFEAQQWPDDDQLLTAVTEEQKKLVDTQREHVESFGQEFGELDEHIVLALASDACETAILNGHEVSGDVARGHIDTSPLFEMLTDSAHTEEERFEMEINTVELLLLGVQNLCPDDLNQWAQGIEGAYTY